MTPQAIATTGSEARCPGWMLGGRETKSNTSRGAAHRNRREMVLALGDPQGAVGDEPSRLHRSDAGDLERGQYRPTPRASPLIAPRLMVLLVLRSALTPVPTPTPDSTPLSRGWMMPVSRTEAAGWRSRRTSAANTSSRRPAGARSRPCPRRSSPAGTPPPHACAG